MFGSERTNTRHLRPLGLPALDRGPVREGESPTPPYGMDDAPPPAPPFDADAPAESVPFSEYELLWHIWQELRASVPGERSETFQAKAITLAAGLAGAERFDTNTPFRHIYIPRTPRVVEVWFGESRNLYMGTFAAGQRVKLASPSEWLAVELAWPAVAEAAQVIVYASSEPFTVESTASA